MVQNEKNEKKKVINKEFKDKLRHVHLMLICSYEGCGADDGWPA